MPRVTRVRRPPISYVMLRLLLALLLWSGAAQAATTVAGVAFPDTYTTEGQALVLNGAGLRTLTILRVRAYVVGLYVARRSHDPQQIIAASTPKVLILQFLHSGSKADVERQFRAGESANCGAGGCNPADQADFDRLVAVAPAVNVGDTFTFVINSRGVRFYGNDRLLAQSSQPDLGRLILLGYIGEHPPSEDVREHLLGLAE